MNQVRELRGPNTTTTKVGGGGGFGPSAVARPRRGGGGGHRTVLARYGARLKVHGAALVEHAVAAKAAVGTHRVFTTEDKLALRRVSDVQWAIELRALARRADAASLHAVVVALVHLGVPPARIGDRVMLIAHEHALNPSSLPGADPDGLLSHLPLSATCFRRLLWRRLRMEEGSGSGAGIDNNANAGAGAGAKRRFARLFDLFARHFAHLVASRRGARGAPATSVVDARTGAAHLASVVLDEIRQFVGWCDDEWGGAARSSTPRRRQREGDAERLRTCLQALLARKVPEGSGVRRAWQAFLNACHAQWRGVFCEALSMGEFGVADLLFEVGSTVDGPTPPFRGALLPMLRDALLHGDAQQLWIEAPAIRTRLQREYATALATTTGAALQHDQQALDGLLRASLRASLRGARPPPRGGGGVAASRARCVAVEQLWRHVLGASGDDVRALHARVHAYPVPLRRTLLLQCVRELALALAAAPTTPGAPPPSSSHRELMTAFVRRHATHVLHQPMSGPATALVCATLRRYLPSSAFEASLGRAFMLRRTPAPHLVEHGLMPAARRVSLVSLGSMFKAASSRAARRRRPDDPGADDPGTDAFSDERFDALTRLNARLAQVFDDAGGGGGASSRRLREDWWVVGAGAAAAMDATIRLMREDHALLGTWYFRYIGLALRLLGWVYAVRRRMVGGGAPAKGPPPPAPPPPPCACCYTPFGESEAVVVYPCLHRVHAPCLPAFWQERALNWSRARGRDRRGGDPEAEEADDDDETTRTTRLRCPVCMTPLDPLSWNDDDDDVAAAASTRRLFAAFSLHEPAAPI